MSEGVSGKTLLCSGSLEGGGSERQLWQLARSLDAERFNPELFLLYRRGIYLDNLPKHMPVHDFWSQARPSPFPFWLPGQIYRRQVKHLCRVIQDRQVKLVYDRTYHMSLITSAACRIMNVPRISVIVSPPSQDFEASQERFAYFKRRLLRSAYSDLNAVTIAVTDEVAADTSTYLRVPRNKIQTVLSPVDVESIQAAAAQEPSFDTPRKIFRDRLFRCCVVGRMSPEKGQQLALEAFAKAMHANPGETMHCDFVGDGPNLASLRSEARRLNVDEHVTFHGFLENPYPIIQASDLLVLPSIYEGLPNVVLEAMALSTAVLATPCSQTLAKILGGECHRFGDLGMQLKSREVDELAEEIVRVRAHPALLQQWRSRAFEYVQSQHDLPTWKRKMEGLFAERIAMGIRSG